LRDNAKVSGVFHVRWSDWLYRRPRLKMAKIEYETPQDFFEALNQEFHFDLDVAATIENAKCKRFFTKEDDGLQCDWFTSGAVWVNPPYDKSIALWVMKAYETSQKGCPVVCLIQGRSTDTKMWHDYVMKSSEIRFIKDRLHFGFNGKSARANISNVLVIFRPHCKGPPKTCSIDIRGRFLIDAV